VQLLIWLIPLLPLIGFLVNGLMGNKIPRGASGLLASVTVLGSFVITVVLFSGLLSNPDISYKTNDIIWFSVGELNITMSLLVDRLSSVMLLIITGVGFLIHLYSIGYMHDEKDYSRYFAYLNLFVFFMLLLVLGSNYVLMFVGWEGVGLCSYLLIGFWYKNNSFNDAAKKAFVVSG
jgi:NADH-quinone oxidoreductase subunit L